MTRPHDHARTAAGLLAAYGVLVLLHALLWQAPAAQPAGVMLLRGIVRGVLALVVAAGLVRGHRWGWQAGVLLGAFWLVMAIAGAALLVTGPGFGVSLPTLITALLATGLLAAAWGLLLTPSVRARYRDR